jgi:hypothetical protein
MLIGIITLITALIISAVAIFYSVAGLVAIFAAAAIPIAIMGTALEIAKLVTAVWLHRYWNVAVWWLKTYLIAAIAVLMLITSIGIFGYLSRAHIEQTATAAESVLAVDRLNAEIQRQTQLIQRAQSAIASLESRTSNTESQIQSQIDVEQSRMDSAYARIQPAIDEQNAVIQREERSRDTRLQTFYDQIDSINRQLSDLQSALSANDVRRAQGIVGVRQDGSLGPDTSRAIQEYREQQTVRRDQLAETVESIKSQPNATVDRARDEIARLRNLAEQQIADSNTLIARLRAQIGQSDQTQTQEEIDQQLSRIQSANQTIESLIEQRNQAEQQYRMLEAEVGPIKYIAEFVYGSSDQDLLEQAVRWLIIVIIFVFDPLAVLLLIASQYTFEHEKSKRARNKEPNNDSRPIQSRIQIQPTAVSETAEHPKPEPTESKSTGTGSQERDMAVSANIDIEISPEMLREQQLLELDNDINWKTAKHLWKEDNPNETLKEWKDRYIRGEIQTLPWESYMNQDSYRQNAEQNISSIWNRIKPRNE